MNQKKNDKLNNAKKIFDYMQINYYEYENGHLNIGGVDYWATSEKWYDNAKSLRGKGLDAFIQHLRNREII